MGLGSVNVPGGGSGSGVASAVSYDNKKSGLVAKNVQAAIDEVNVSAKAAKPLTGKVDPSEKTPGAVGQHYMNTVTGREFVCIEADDETGTYKWETNYGVPLDSGSTVAFSVGCDAGGVYMIFPDNEK